jgi:hypothetical protein
MYVLKHSHRCHHGHHRAIGTSHQAYTQTSCRHSTPLYLHAGEPSETGCAKYYHTAKSLHCIGRSSATCHVTSTCTTLLTQAAHRKAIKAVLFQDNPKAMGHCVLPTPAYRICWTATNALPWLTFGSCVMSCSSTKYMPTLLPSGGSTSTCACKKRG